MQRLKRKQIANHYTVLRMCLCNWIRINMKIFLCICLMFTTSNGTNKMKKGALYQPVEWVYEDVTYSGNPFDVVAEATFTHKESGENIKTELFYSGESIWTLRFIAIRTGNWIFSIKSQNKDLDGLTGQILIEENPGTLGFITHEGNKWTRMGMGELAFVPNYVMYYTPDGYYNKPGLIDNDIQTFFIEHGFNGFHTRVACRWFDLFQDNSDNITDPNPDLKTFEALELLITKVNAAGGVVHIWLWGDDQRHQTPVKWGINGKEDKRLQRYIAARLGPLPGWSMNYGFDLNEWVQEKDLKEWHDTMHAYMGWHHYLGARSGELDQIYEGMDYASYTHYKPFYYSLLPVMELRTDKPVISEDCFRIRNSVRYAYKDYTMLETRRGLWQATMAGGIGGIWGNLLTSPDGYASAPYPNPEQIKTYARFWEKRLLKSFIIDNTLIDGIGVCLKDTSESRFVFYKENTSFVILNLSGMKRKRPVRAIAVDTKMYYKEIDVGILYPKDYQRIELPYYSDWGLSVGWFQPETGRREIEIDDLKIIPKKVLDTTGFSADLAYNPIDRSLHTIWVNSGDIYHVMRDASGQWHSKESVPDGGYNVYGQEEDDVPRKCLAATFDTEGVLHLVFAERGGDVYYLFKKEGHWSEPTRVIEKPPYTIYLDLESVKGTLFCVYEDGDRDVIYTMTCREGKWSTPKNMGPSEYPSLTSGGDGRIYFLCRNNFMNNSNAKLAYRNVEEDDWTFIYDVTDAPKRLSQGPGLAVCRGRMYLAWSNSTEIYGPKYCSLHCAFSYEPGINWTPRIGGIDALYYTEMGDPHPRVAVFSDGTVLLMNGKYIRPPRFMIWDGSNWSHTRKAPWQSGILQVQCDGKTVWIASSESSRGSGEVSVSGIVQPTAQLFDTNKD